MKTSTTRPIPTNITNKVLCRVFRESSYFLARNEENHQIDLSKALDPYKDYELQLFTKKYKFGIDPLQVLDKTLPSAQATIDFYLGKVSNNRPESFWDLSVPRELGYSRLVEGLAALDVMFRMRSIINKTRNERPTKSRILALKNFRYNVKSFGSALNSLVRQYKTEADGQFMTTLKELIEKAKKLGSDWVSSMNLERFSKSNPRWIGIFKRTDTKRSWEKFTSLL